MDMRRMSLALVLLMVFSTTLSMIETTHFSPLVDENSETSARNGATAWLQDRADTLGNAGSHSSIEQAPDGTLWVAHTKDGDLWVTNDAAGYWNSEQIYSFGSTGRLANLQIDSSGNPRIAHFDASEHIIRVSRYDGSSWSSSFYEFCYHSNYCCFISISRILGKSNEICKLIYLFMKVQV